MIMQTSSAPPDTSSYFRAAYVIAAALYTGYMLSLWWRARRLNQ
jgi:hypothetical protein